MCLHAYPIIYVSAPLHLCNASRTVLFCSLAVLDPRVGHTMNALSPFISVILTDCSMGSPVHVLMLSIQAVRGLPRLRAPGIVPCVISFSPLFPHHSMLASLLWRCLTVSTHLFSLVSMKPAESFAVLSSQRRRGASRTRLCRDGIISTVRVVYGAGSVKRYGVRPSVCPCCCRFAAVGQAGSIYRSIAAAVACECGQCHAVSVRR